jgi:mannitol-1-phosphate 5-dehydrogenase
VVRALIVGAGAIGRGFVPWSLIGARIDFFDSSDALCSVMTQNGGFTTHMTSDGVLSSLRVTPGLTTSSISDLDLDSYDVVFVSVGPRNVDRIPVALSGVRGPIFSLENDPISVDQIRTLLKREDVFFGVPDVIASSTASESNLAKDPLSLHTEDGVLYLEDSDEVSPELRSALSKVQWLPQEQMRAEWDAKLYLHNTPHCVAAYLAFIQSKTFVHEGFESREVETIVSGVITEMLTALKFSTSHDHDFLNDYARKELRRFSNNLLFDPVLRVAREPVRKLQKNGRLTGALRLAMISGVEPYYLTLGIASALLYKEPRDSDYGAILAVQDLGYKDFLKFHIGLEHDSLETLYLDRHLANATSYLMRRLK